MKAFIVLVVIATLAIIIFQYIKSKNLKKLLIALASFGLIVSLGVMGNLTRPIIPIFLAHIVLLIVSWGGLMFYLWRERYYWWVILSPIVTIALFLILEILTGSGHEYLTQNMQ